MSDGMVDAEAGMLPCLAAFAAVAEAGSFSIAARNLQTTRSAVSKQIQRLERAWGVRLLSRTNRKISLTEPGRMALRSAVGMVQSYENARTSAQRLSDVPAGRLRLTAPVSYGNRVLAPLLPDFFLQYPQIEIDLVLNDQYVDLIENQVDLAIRIGDQPASGLSGRRLHRVRYFVCAAPGLEGIEWIREPKDLLRLRALQPPGSFDWVFRRNLEEVRIRPDARLAVNNSETRLFLATSGQGAAILADYTCKEALASGTLVVLLPEWQVRGGWGADAWIVRTPEPRPLPKVAAMSRYLLTHVGRTDVTG